MHASEFSGVGIGNEILSLLKSRRQCPETIVGDLNGEKNGAEASGVGFLGHML